MDMTDPIPEYPDQPDWQGLPTALPPVEVVPRPGSPKPRLLDRRTDGHPALLARTSSSPNSRRGLANHGGTQHRVPRVPGVASDPQAPSALRTATGTNAGPDRRNRMVAGDLSEITTISAPP